MSQLEPLELVEVVIEEIGVPADDGSPGSALYLVPIRLNRKPSPEETPWILSVWDHPPSFSNMHRPGILRVRGDVLLLDGTTIEEVERYHVPTLKGVLTEVNARAATLAVQQAQVAADEVEQRAHLAEVARRIDLS